MVLHRCGYAPELYSDVSGCILDFNTEITASILGSAASTLSQSVLREIGVTVKSLERQQSRTFDSFGDTVYNEARKNDERRFKAIWPVRSLYLAMTTPFARWRGRPLMRIWKRPKR